VHLLEGETTATIHFESPEEVRTVAKFCEDQMRRNTNAINPAYRITAVSTDPAALTVTLVQRPKDDLDEDPHNPLAEELRSARRELRMQEAELETLRHPARVMFNRGYDWGYSHADNGVTEDPDGAWVAYLEESR
jgi:hypothetical protein